MTKREPSGDTIPPWLMEKNPEVAELLDELTAGLEPGEDALWVKPGWAERSKAAREPGAEQGPTSPPRDHTQPHLYPPGFEVKAAERNPASPEMLAISKQRLVTLRNLSGKPLPPDFPVEEFIDVSHTQRMTPVPPAGVEAASAEAPTEADATQATGAQTSEPALNEPATAHLTAPQSSAPLALADPALSEAALSERAPDDAAAAQAASSERAPSGATASELTPSQFVHSSAAPRPEAARSRRALWAAVLLFGLLSVGALILVIRSGASPTDTTSIGSHAATPATELGGSPAATAGAAPGEATQGEPARGEAQALDKDTPAAPAEPAPAATPEAAPPLPQPAAKPAAAPKPPAAPAASPKPPSRPAPASEPGLLSEEF